MTPLHYASKIGNSEICNLLLKSGAHIDARDNVSRLHSLKLIWSDIVY